jgi:hypothetical protein
LTIRLGGFRFFLGLFRGRNTIKIKIRGCELIVTSYFFILGKIPVNHLHKAIGSNLAAVFHGAPAGTVKHMFCTAGDIPRFLNTVRDYSSDRNLHFNLKPAAVQ